MTVAESKNLRKGSRVCWLGYGADSGRRCWGFVVVGEDLLTG